MDEPRATPRLGRESAAVAAGALVLALAALRARPAWLNGVIGDHDAWQNLWNLHHVDRALRAGTPLFHSDQVWAPEGASLLAHTLSLPNSLPGALLGRVVGFFLAYNLLVVFSYVLAATALYRLARRMGAGRSGAALGALVFGFAPQRSARALGHLNLLGSGWIPLALEGLWAAVEARGRRRLATATAAGLALVALVYTDWYLALLGALAAGAYSIFALARAPRDARAGTFSALAIAGAVAFAGASPFAYALAREASGEGTVGHDARWCSTACTSLLIPSRIQLASTLTRGLTERNHQNVSEAASYLGLVPLLLTAWVTVGKRRFRALDFALAAGGAGLVLALGPQLRVFDRLLDVPLPYAWLEKVVPALRVGGCPNRYIALVFLPLALGTALAATRLLARGRLAGVVVATMLIVLEYAPVDPGAAVWPLNPPDPAMVAIASSGAPGNVLDVDGGIAASIRQLRHGRPQLFGYIARTPPAPLARRLSDPVLGPLLDPSRPSVALPPAAAAVLLRHRWGVAFVVTPDVAPYRDRARALGFPPFAATAGLSAVFRVPSEPVPAVDRVEFAATVGSDLLARGVFAWGFGEAGAADVAGQRLTGRWCGPEATLVAPLAPGTYRLRLAAAEGTVRVRAVWGKDRETVRTLAGTEELGLEVTAADLAPDGVLALRLRPEGFGGGRLLAVSLER